MVVLISAWYKVGCTRDLEKKLGYELPWGV